MNEPFPLLGAFLVNGLALLNRFPGSKARAFVGAYRFTPCVLEHPPLTIMLEVGEPLTRWDKAY